MKNKFIYPILISIVLFSCKGFTNEKEPAINPNECTQYACPIHQDKTSTLLEKCPTCDALMIPADSLKKDSLKRVK